jgi:poly(3-hydroxyalkanoate) synthetase
MVRFHPTGAELVERNIPLTSISLHESALATTKVARRSTTSLLDAWQSTTLAGLRYWSKAAAGGTTPLGVAADGLRWLELVTTRRPPDWSTPSRLVESSGIMALRDFSTDGREDVTPTLIVPPQAGHHSCIVDYSVRQSQVRTALEAGLTRAFVLEWLGATQETKNAGILDYLGSVRRAITHIGGPVNLIGDCQGGWLATIYAALHPDDVATLTIGGAPIDFHAGDSAITDFTRCAGGITPYRLAVELGGGVLDGRLMLSSFIGLQPETEISKQVELVLNLDDDDYVERYRAFQDWYMFTQPIPGAMYLWAVEHLFIENELVRGILELDGRVVSLGAIRCPVNLLGGTTDHITPPAQVFALADHVGTSPSDVTTTLTNGGHLGLFMGREALETAWRPMFEKIAARSGRT